MAHRKGVVRYEENPFFTEQSLTTNRRRVKVNSSKKAILDLDTGELEETAEIVMVREVDSEQFVKLYTQNIKAFFELSSTTLKLLQVLLSQVQKHPNTDKVMLNVNLAQVYFTQESIEPMSKASFHRSVRELLDKQFIAETMLSGLFFINPNLFFNGDRVRFVNEIKRKKADAKHAKLVSRIKSGELSGGTQTTVADPGQIDLEEWLGGAGESLKETTPDETLASG